MAKENPSVEKHPLQPFLPEGARILMLGSFPPKKERWSMEFFYPNWRRRLSITEECSQKK